MKRIVLLLILLSTTLGLAQVGVNTTTPDPSSMLDVSATNKGVLVPRVSLPNVTTTMLDGTNTAATGLLIWNTNATAIGGNGVGFYFFNGAIWVPITQSSAIDHDFYEVGTTSPPNSTLDDIYKFGKLNIGTSATTNFGASLYVQDFNPNNNSGLTVSRSLNTPNSTGNSRGVFSSLQGFSTDNYRNFDSSLTGTFSSTSSNHFAINSASSSSDLLLYDGIFTANSGSGRMFGYRSIFNTGITNTSSKYGFYTSINNSLPGTHYGIYSDATKSGSYAGYFLGNVSIGTTSSNNYILPVSRGTNGQIMQTDGTGNVSWITPTTETDDQNLTTPTLTGTTLNLGIENGTGTSINLASLDTDNQQIDVLTLTGDTLNISLQDDGVATQTLNLAAIDNQATDVFSLTGTTLNLSLQNDGVATQSVDLSSLDTDNQIIDAFSLTGTTLNLSLENDAMATQTVDLSSIVGDDDWTDVGTDIERQTGDVYIGDTSATNNNLYISNQIIDWDNTTYFLDPATANRVNEVQFDNGSATDPSITFTEQNTGFFSPYNAATAYSANGTEAFRIQSNGNIAIGQTIDPNYSLSVSTLGGNSNIEIGNKDINENVMNISHNGDRANALNVAALSSYNLASRSSISATNTLGASAVDIARFETVSNNTYGVKSIITNNPSGNEYGIYSEALQANGFAGYFLGRMSIGTTTANNYILPPSRGTNGQIMQTDAAGNVTWVNPPTDTDDQGTDVFSLTGNTLNLSLQNDGVATQTVDLSSLKDADWYEVGGTNSPDAISDNKFTLGDISIGKTTAANGKLDVDAAVKNVTASFTNNNTTTGSKWGIQNNVTVDPTNNLSYGISNSMAGNANFKYGILNSLSGNVTGSAYEYGLVNSLTSGGLVNSYGVFNGFNPSTPHSGFYNGIYNVVSGTNHNGGFIGVDNVAAYATANGMIGINNSLGGSGSGSRIGVRNMFNGTSTGDVTGINTEILATGTGDKYGERIQISPISGGTHYGVYSDALKANSFAGYFLGNVSVGTTTTNNYILPPSRGSNGQIMQTDGSGTVSWADAPSDADWYEVGGTNPAGSILDNIYTGGDVSIGKATAATGKVDIEADNKTSTLVLENNNASTGAKYGIQNNLTVNTSNLFSAALQNTISGNTLFKSGVSNFFDSNNNTGASITETGYDNVFYSAGDVNFVGGRNLVSSNTSGYIIGYENYIQGATTGVFTGFRNFNLNNNNSKTGLLNFLGGSGSGDISGTVNSFSGSSNGEHIGINTYISSFGTGLKYGEKIEIDNTSGGIHFGVYADVTKANSFAGYFLGRVSLGTTIANNYILPSSRGTLGQIMVTNGTGDVSWVNPSIVFSDTDDQQIDVLSLTGNTLNLSLQNDAVATQTVDLSTLANDWKLTGNAGTASGTNFIGTTDAQDLSFRTNNLTRLTLTQRGQLSITNTGGSVLVGSGAGDADDFTLNQNTFIGTVSGESTSSGNLNSALGFNSLNGNTLGLGNTAVGANALNVNVDGNNNTGLGRGANVSTTNLTNATAVGFNSTVNAANKIRLGNVAITVVEGQVAYTNPSDARFKFNVKEDVPGLDFIKKLKPVTYNFDTKKFDEHLNQNRNKDEVTTEDFATSTAIIRTGFLAQDVEKICTDLGYNFDGLHVPDASNPTDNYGIAYSQFIMPIVKAVQEQQVIIESQKTELDQLKLELEKYKMLEERIKALEQK